MNFWTSIWFLPILVVLIAAFFFLRAKQRHAKRLAWMKLPAPKEWHAILAENVPVYTRIPLELRARLHGHMHIFLNEVNFEGCGGLELTEEMRVTIAAQACLLLVGQEAIHYPRLRSVLVYPSTFVAGGKGTYGGQFDDESARLGESWQHGTVVLSWNSVQRGGVNFEDGHNVAIHEFAHQLDQENSAVDGAPILENNSAYKTWARVFQEEYDDFLERVEKGKRTVIDDYGATEPAEFFSTATEAFFEKPDQLAKKRPELFEELRKYYRVDPREW